jgi:hypothetical protein
MNNQKHTHICHRPKLPMLDCTSSDVSSVLLSALPTGGTNNIHVINLPQTALQFTGWLKNSEFSGDLHRAFQAAQDDLQNCNLQT